MRPLGFWLLLLMVVVGTGRTLQGQSSAPFSVANGSAVNGWQPVLRVNGILTEPAFREALESGLPLRFHFRIELWQKAFLDRLVGTQEFEVALIRDPLEGNYTLTHGRSQILMSRLEDAERMLLANTVTVIRPRRRGRYYYLAVLEVETLSLSDLEELQRWLRGEARPAVRGRTPAGRAVGRGVQRAFVRMIGLPTRRYESRSPTFTVD